MPTNKQILGEYGEQLVARECSCAKCKRNRTLRRLPPNFKCADLICDFCGFLAQVKSSAVSDIDQIPPRILGAAWGPQKERMDAAIYFPLFLVLATPDLKKQAIYYLSADLQQSSLFKPRKPLSSTARRAGWTGFVYDTKSVEKHFVRLV